MVSDRGWGSYFGSDCPDQAQEAITKAHSLDINLTICSTVWGRSAGRRQTHTSYLLRIPRIYPCKFFLPGVKLYRFNAKNWQFTVCFAVITQKIGILLCILS